MSSFLMRKIVFSILLILCYSLVAHADSDISFSGSLQHDGLFAMQDDEIGTEDYSFPYLSNTYLNLMLSSKWVNAGLRVETMEAPLPGYEGGFKGSGIGNIYIQGKWEWGKLTIGDVYSQFGSGLILRLYEERNLGIDNSLRGGRLELTPYKGIRIEAIGGKQRVYWNCYNKTAWNFNMSQGAVVGGDIELDIDEWSQTMQQKGMTLNIGASWVSKYEPQDTIFKSYAPPTIYNLPRWVGAADARVQFGYKGFSLLAEYAWKANDPSADNNFSYAHGEALLLSASYSRRGLSALLQVKRSENMAFRSDRLARGNAAYINHLPPFTQAHTYYLADLNAYATQLQGEWAFQGELRYTWKRHTAMGGRHGTTLRLHAAHIRGTSDKNWWASTKETYYTDINLELNKRISKRWYINAMYMYQTFNAQVIEGHGELIRSHIVVADVKYVTSDKVEMRAELQYLFSRQDEGQWLYALYELSLFNDLMITVSDMYNIGGTDISSRLNYYMVAASYQKGAHNISLGFGRSRAGYSCVGGVCRFVPAEKGVRINYNFTF